MSDVYDIINSKVYFSVHHCCCLSLEVKARFVYIIEEYDHLGCSLSLDALISRYTSRLDHYTSDDDSIITALCHARLEKVCTDVCRDCGDPYTSSW